MSTDQIRIVVTAVLYVVVFVSGVFLTRSGKPYSTLVLTAHKLISLAALAYLVVTMIQANRVATLTATQVWSGTVAGVFFLGSIATGGILSTDKPAPPFVLILHRVTPFLTVLASAIALYLLLGQQ